ncbi:MAG: hypothetical protein GX923_10725 [Clostridia bacterium]|jgi:stage III sporulation protein AG|nr:hypothetical protein [Clostridia bacterium]
MGGFFSSLFPEDKSKQNIKITQKQKKYIMGLLMVIAIGILVMSFSDFGFNNQDKDIYTFDSSSSEVEQNISSSLTEIEKHMEARLTSILSQIEGVGQVAINIFLESSMEYEYAVNTNNDQTVVSEQAQDGSTRTTNDTREEAQVVMKSLSQGKNEPVVIKEIRPEVAGVMVVAEGANDILIREKISQGVQTVLNIPAHRVTVLPKGK